MGPLPEAVQGSWTPHMEVQGAPKVFQMTGSESWSFLRPGLGHWNSVTPAVSTRSGQSQSPLSQGGQDKGPISPWGDRYRANSYPYRTTGFGGIQREVVGVLTEIPDNGFSLPYRTEHKYHFQLKKSFLLTLKTALSSGIHCYTWEMGSNSVPQSFLRHLFLLLKLL